VPRGWEEAWVREDTDMRRVGGTQARGWPGLHAGGSCHEAQAVRHPGLVIRGGQLWQHLPSHSVQHVSRQECV
jgi:hypothetical protein